MARPYIWTPAKEQVFNWTHEVGWTHAEMAAQLGVSRRTIEGWTRRKAFKMRSKAHSEAYFAQMQAEWRAKMKREAEALRVESEARVAADLAAIRAKYGRWAT